MLLADRAPNAAARDDFIALIERLEEMPAEPLGGDISSVRVLRFNAEAQELFDVWHETLEHRLRNGSEHPTIEAHLCKYRSLVPSLALLIHLADGGKGSVELLALERAIAWAEYLESHARRIYAPAVTADMGAAKSLAKRIEAGDIGLRFAARDVYNKGWSGLATREDVAAATAVLVDHDWLLAIVEQTAGRPRTTYVVNPAVRGGKS